MRNILSILIFLLLNTQLLFAQKLEREDSIFISNYLKLSPTERLTFFDAELGKTLTTKYFFFIYKDLQVLAKSEIPYNNIVNLSGVNDFPFKRDDSTYFVFMEKFKSNIGKKTYLSKDISKVKTLTATSDFKILKEYLSNNIFDRITFLERNFTKLSKSIVLMICIDLNNICGVKSNPISDNKTLKKACLLWKSKLR